MLPKKLIRLEVVAYLILLIISCIVFHRWINFSILSYGDYLYRFPETLREVENSLWIASKNIGMYDILFWRFPIQGMYIFLNFLKLNLNNVDKFILFFPIIFISPLVTYYVINKILQSKIGALVGTLVFSYNTYYLAIATQGHLLLILPGSLLLLSLFAYIKLQEIEVNPRNLYYYYIVLFTANVIGFLDLRMLYILIFSMFLYLIFTIYVNKSKSRLNIIKNIMLFFFFLFILVGLNLYWILPGINVGIITNNAILSRDLFGSSFFDIARAITLFHPFWTGTEINWFAAKDPLWYFFLYPIFAFLGFIFNKKDRIFQYFALIGVLGIFFAKQISPPFGPVYELLFKYLPGFSAFREASKFYALILISYSILIGGFIDWIWKGKRFKLSLKYSITIIIVGISLWNTKPLITGEIGTLFIARTIPRDYIIFKNKVVKDMGFYRTLWVPTDSRWTIYLNSHPKISLVDITNTSWASLASHTKQNIERTAIPSLLYSPSFDMLADVSCIKYVIVPIQDTANDDDFFKYYSKREEYVSLLDNTPWLKKIDIGTKELAIYENEGYRPHIYTTSQKETIYKDIPYEKTSFSFKNPTEYTIRLNSVKSPHYLNFSEAFHPDWKLRVGEFSWVKILTNKNYFINDKYHSESDAKLNSFYIDPKAICKEYTCKKNADGSYNIAITLYFRSQSYMYLGLIISGIILTLSIMHLIKHNILNINKK